MKNNPTPPEWIQENPDAMILWQRLLDCTQDATAETLEDYCSVSRGIGEALKALFSEPIHPEVDGRVAVNWRLKRLQFDIAHLLELEQQLGLGVQLPRDREKELRLAKAFGWVK